MSTVYSVSLPNSLKETLEEIVNDPHEGLEARSMYRDYYQVGNMDDQWFDDLEMGGIGLLSELDEGAELKVGSIREGTLWRYTARRYGGKVIITDIALEDSKYKEIIQATKRVNRAMWKTVAYDAANIFVRGWNTNFVFGDGQPLFSSSHTIPDGGTFSNTMAVPMSPSLAALIVVQSTISKWPGHDGTVGDSYRMMKVISPIDQWAVWGTILGSEKDPKAGNFAAINIVKRDFDVKVCATPFWRNTTTNWAVKTDCPNGLKWFWRRRPRSRQWLDNDFEIRKFGISARWARGISDPRGVYGVQYGG